MTLKYHSLSYLFRLRPSTPSRAGSSSQASFWVMRVPAGEAGVELRAIGQPCECLLARLVVRGVDDEAGARDRGDREAGRGGGDVAGRRVAEVLGVAGRLCHLV